MGECMNWFYYAMILIAILLSIINEHCFRYFTIVFLLIIGARVFGLI
jgi:hypothetical protein